MSDEIEYIEPTQEHVGQMVEVRHAETATHRTRKLLAVLPHPIKYRFVCQDSVNTVLSSHWQSARIARPLTYAERQAKCGLKVGDRVKFVRAWVPGELGVHLTFIDGMERDVGKVGVVKSLGRSIFVEFTDTSLFLPYFVLEKVEDRVATHDDCGKTVYIDGAPLCEFKIVLVWQEFDDVWRAVVRSGDNRLVYELSNLRVKE